VEKRFERYHPDMDAMHHGFRTQPCFICRMVQGDVRFPENIIYEDDRALVFLDGYPRAYGYTLVAPKEHREQVTGDFSIAEYLDLQRLLYRVSEAVREEVGAERMYLYAFGSNQGNGTTLACSAVAARGALRRAAGGVGHLEQGGAQDPAGRDGLAR
jgi:galactose-1-phosphate uridylyltransferase